ncbi:sensor histidine kinase [Streptomyces alfalfae]|uniref:sensor histidine kinase n=1 Tax=Streptomyces alfalfae TaxID=1642299 RepID=UPI0028122302|nr:histidine kinase [Streptomyces alfalfae]
MALSLARPHRVDITIAAVSLLSGLALWALGLHTQPGRDLGGTWALIPLAVLACLELVRRTAPQAALTVGTLALVADQFTEGNLASIMMFTDIVYAAVVYGTPAAARRIPVTTGLITVAVTVGFLAWFREPEAILIGVITGVISFGPATTGVLVRNHREAADAARLRAEQTALLAEMDRVQAVTAERARMARELHDMVANHLSAIAIHSTAALSLDDPRTSADALAVIRENSVEGLAEMRRLIGILRDDSGDLEPAAAPTLDGLAALVAGARANGLDVTLDDSRPPQGPKLPAPVELAAYRIVQESLTNALKHASPGRVAVTLAQGPRALTVRVSSPYGDPSGPRAPGSGAGLVGMRERTELLGGAFEAGPENSPDGTVWSVFATLPVDPADEGAKE